jgi:hypothetical protein
VAVSIAQSVSLCFVLTGIFTQTVSPLTDTLADSEIALASFADSLSGNFGDSAKFQGTQSVPALSFNLDNSINHKSSNSWHLSSDISLSPWTRMHAFLEWNNPLGMDNDGQHAEDLFEDGNAYPE